MTFQITVVILFEATSRVQAENEAKRIYAGIDDCVAEQNDPKNTVITLALHRNGEVIRSITTERR